MERLDFPELTPRSLKRINRARHKAREGKTVTLKTEHTNIIIFSGSPYIANTIVL